MATQTSPTEASSRGRRPDRNNRSLWPREHGAYMQLGFPMISAILAGESSLPVWSLACAAWLAFLAHEPWLVWAGKRGQERKRAQQAQAVRRLVVLAGSSFVLAALALAAAPAPARVAAVVVAVLAAAAFLWAERGQERTLVGQVFVAWTLAAVAAPIALLGGLPPASALLLAALWAAGATLMTLTARGVIYFRRDRGTQLRVAAALGITLAGLSVFASSWLGAVWPAGVVLFALTTLGLWWHPPPPQRAKTLGWGLTLANAGVLLWIALSFQVT